MKSTIIQQQLDNMIENTSNYKLFFNEKAAFRYIKMSKNKNNKTKTTKEYKTQTKTQIQTKSFQNINRGSFGLLSWF